jgi:paraquat-inducible protein B
MWKKQSDPPGEQPDSFSNQVPDLTLESASETLMEAYRSSKAEKAKFGVGAQEIHAGPQPVPPTTMATYTEAMNEFTKNANAFIEQLPLLKKARNAYEQAMRANAELRKVLDTSEENLRALMTGLEQAVSPASEKRRPEPAKVEAIRGTEEPSGGVREA